MGLTEAPAWLVPAFVRSARAAGATAPAPELEERARALLSDWARPERHHHAIQHLIQVLASIDQLAEETHDPDLVRIAGWYHGAEFASDRRTALAHKAGEDPLAGAARARRELPALGVPDSVVERIATMIEQTHRHAAPAQDVDAQALCDADLSGLAAEPQRYAAYRRNVRAEYAHIDPATYLEARIAILRRLAARSRIFASPMATCWEEPARQNITAELAVLEAELEQVEQAEEAGESVAPVPWEVAGTGAPHGAAAADRPDEVRARRESENRAEDHRDQAQEAQAGDRAQPEGATPGDDAPPDDTPGDDAPPDDTPPDDPAPEARQPARANETAPRAPEAPLLPERTLSPADLDGTESTTTLGRAPRPHRRS